MRTFLDQRELKVNSFQRLPEKQKIARSFGRAAGNYDQYAHWQRDIADKMFSLLDLQQASSILDLGSGTGYCAEKLITSYPAAMVTNLDLAEAMLGHAKKSRYQAGLSCAGENWLCGDAESLPFKDNSFDLVMSNLAIQWCQNLPQVFKELFRVMKPGAQAWVSTLAERTLVELRDSWSSIDSFVHVNSFLECEKIIETIKPQPFTSIKHSNTREIYFYDSLRMLTDELKGVGAHNLNTGQPSGLTSKYKLSRLIQVFEQNRISGKGIPVTYDLVLIHLVK